MIYEFVGLPGSGKTHHAKELSERLSIPLIAELTRRQRFLGAAAFSLSHPIVTMRLLYEIFGEEHLSRGLLRHKLFFLLANTLAREIKAARVGDAVVDEGIFQYLYSLYEHPMMTGDVERYVDIIKPFVHRSITVLDVPQHIRNDRMTHRGRIPRSIFGGSYGETWSAVLEANHHMFVERLSQGLSGTAVTIEHH